jgi:hypothetical protein
MILATFKLSFQTHAAFTLVLSGSWAPQAGDLPALLGFDSSHFAPDVSPGPQYDQAIYLTTRQTGRFSRKYQSSYFNRVFAPIQLSKNGYYPSHLRKEPQGTAERMKITLDTIV